MENRDCLIITGGILSEDLIKEYIITHPNAILICVDGALELVHKMKLVPDYIVGDFDTVRPDLIMWYEKQVALGKIKTQIRRFPPHKDETDTHIAVLLAMEVAATNICIMGGIGSRMDHTLANLHLLLQPLKKGIHAYLQNEHNVIYLKEQPFQIEKKATFGDYISLIPFKKTVHRVTLNGFKYNTNAVDFTIEGSLGISNELVEETGSVTFTKGIFIVIEAND
ncbi:MAG: thiamine pyrophosphokinae [Clostridiales bacterium]|nr:thiamine pyrophosphokinae [Clostridiales bacterium]